MKADNWDRPFFILFKDLKKIETSRGKKGSTRKAVAFGSLAGMVAGAVIARTTEPERDFSDVGRPQLRGPRNYHGGRPSRRWNPRWNRFSCFCRDLGRSAIGKTAHEKLAVMVKSGN